MKRANIHRAIISVYIRGRTLVNKRENMKIQHRQTLGSNPLGFFFLSIGLMIVLPFGFTPANAQVTLSNGTPSGTLGHYEITVVDGGNISPARSTSERISSGALTTADVYNLTSYVDIGSGGININSFVFSIVTMPVTLTAPNEATSKGRFTGSNGNQIDWTSVTTLAAGATQAETKYLFEAVTGSLGTIQLSQYLDTDLFFFNDDVIKTSGSAAGGDLQVIAYDDSEVYGVFQSGSLTSADGLINSSFLGWTAGQFPDVELGIFSGASAFTLTGTVSTNLPPFVHPIAGASFGPGDVTSAMGWEVDETASEATIVVTSGALNSADGIEIVGDVSGHVWWDAVGADGVIGNDDLSQNGLNGVEVILYNTDGTVTEVGRFTTVTDSGDQGFYSFPDLPIGSYEVSIDTNTFPWLIDQFTTATLSPFSFITTESFEVNFGATPVTAKVSGVVWYDLANQGVLPAASVLASEGIAGATVTLFEVLPSGALNAVQSVTSGAGGSYSFDTVFGNEYAIQVDLATLPESPPVFTTPSQYIIDLSSGGDVELNFGILRFASLAGSVWFDLNQNSNFDEDPAAYALPGALVEIYRISGGTSTLEMTVTADANGEWTANGLIAGVFEARLQFASLPNPSSTPTTPGVQTLDLTAGGQARAEFGVYDTNAPGNICGTVWFDLVGEDGNLANDDLALSGFDGVEVVLFEVDPVTFFVTRIATSITATASVNGSLQRGFFEFRNVRPGNYAIGLILAALPDTVTALTTAPDYRFQLDSFEKFTGNFGLVGTPPPGNSNPPTPVDPVDPPNPPNPPNPGTGSASISGTAWNDFTVADGDPSNEVLALTGIQGLRIELLDLAGGGSTLFTTTTSGTEGSYQFTDIPAGDYLVRADLSTLGISVAQFTTPTEYSLSLLEGDNVSGQNFGFLASPTAIDDFDIAANQIGADLTIKWQHPDESFVLGYRVYLDGVVATDFILADSGTYAQTIQLEAEPSASAASASEAAAPVIDVEVVHSDLSSKRFGPIGVTTDTEE